MDRKKLVLLLGALIIAVGTAFAARSLFLGSAAPQADAAPPAPLGPKVLVANRALTAGTIITADSMGFQQWPEELVQDAYFIDGEADISSLLGTVVRFPITAGEPVTQGSLVKPGDRGFLAAALSPGMRAVTVPVSARTGVAGFVFPGDRVDLLLTSEFEDQNGDNGELQGAETILANLRVLATDQRTEKVEDPESGKTVVNAFRTVTLEATPAFAERISVAQSMGTLSLALRPLADNQAELERAIAAGDINIPENATIEEEERILAQARLQPIVGKRTYETSFDVSKFQRDTLAKWEAERKREEAQKKAQEIAAARALAEAQAAGRNLTGAGRDGPVVRVIRGTQAAEVPVNGSGRRLEPGEVENGANGLISAQSSGLRDAGNTVPAASAALIK
ncbi:MAG: Flp pilus assembly protein CpaB [Pseudomonadota bacterium]